MARRWLQALRLLLGLALWTTLVAGCESGAPGPGHSPAATGVIAIGAELALTGSQADVGWEVENGIRLAIEQANRQHVLAGYTLVLQTRDDVGASGQSDPSIGAVDALEFVSDAQVAGILGPLASNVARAQLPLTNQRGIVQISPASSASCLTQETAASGCAGPADLLPLLRPTGRLTYFRLAPPANLQGALTADFAYHTLTYRRVYVLSDGHDDADDLAASFSSQFATDGGRIAGHRHLAGAGVSAAEARSIVLAAPDAIYLVGHDPGAVAAIAALRIHLAALAPRRAIPLLIGDTLTAAMVAHAPGAGPAPAGPIYAVLAPAPAPTSAQAADFAQAYRERYGPPGVYSAGGYDCAWVLIHALAAALRTGAKPAVRADDNDAAASFRQAVIAATGRTDEQGVTGHVSFDSAGDTTNRVVAIYQQVPGGQAGWNYIGVQAAP